MSNLQKMKKDSELTCKKLKGLEELEKVLENYKLASKFNGDFLPYWRQDELLEPIKKELKEGEKDHELKVEICEFFGLDDLFPYDDSSKIMERLKEIQGHYYDIQFKKSKKEKALEIIKEKGIILQFIKETYTAEQYNAGVFGTLVKPLTEEEYELLKEVLL